jgi:hypothetical protein
MNVQYRLGKDDLMTSLLEWDEVLRKPVLVVACGGTALTLYGHKESTKDVDFLVPILSQHDLLVSTLLKIGYVKVTGSAYRHPHQPWLYDLFRGQTVFQTDLLDPIQEEGNHREILKFKRLQLGCLNPADLIISKMFRGTSVDVDDSITMIKSENLDLQMLAERYKETAGYYFYPERCKQNLQYLIAEMDLQQLNTDALREMNEQWTA